MEMPSEIVKLILLLNNGMIWLVIIAFFIIMYLLISLLTWSFLKPLKYLGIPTIVTGVFFLIIRFASGFIATLLTSQIPIIRTLLPSLLKPVLITGLGCLIIGIAMVVLYGIINSKLKKHNEIVVSKETEKQESSVAEDR